MARPIAIHCRLIRSILTLALLIGLSVALPGLFSVRPAYAASATSIVVNDNGDSAVCTTQITLRCAIASANGATKMPVTITFSVSGTITVGSVLSINNVNQPITIDGGAQAISVDGGGATQIFNIASNTTVTLNSLTISHGGYLSFTDAGGVLNNGTLTISRSTLSNNQNNRNGGAVLNNSTMIINDSTLSNNRADFGGGIYNDSTGSLTINRSTFFQNITSFYGAGVFNHGTITIDNSTFYTVIASC